MPAFGKTKVKLKGFGMVNHEGISLAACYRAGVVEDLASWIDRQEFCPHGDWRSHARDSHYFSWLSEHRNNGSQLESISESVYSALTKSDRRIAFRAYRQAHKCIAIAEDRGVYIPQVLRMAEGEAQRRIEEWLTNDTLRGEA